MAPCKLERTLLPAIALGLGAFYIFEAFPIDLWLQDHFYNFAQHRWMVDQDAPLPKLLFYDGIKKVITVFGFSLLALALAPRSWLNWFGIPAPARRRLWVVILTLASIPALVGWMKTATNVYCPYDIQRYGGEVPYVRTIDPYPAGERPMERSRGFPAGHPSGGYALMALAGLAATRRGQWIGFGIGFAVGGMMGLYQMAKGAHYLSHNVVTFFLAWIGFILWYRLLVQPGSLAKEPAP